MSDIATENLDNFEAFLAIVLDDAKILRQEFDEILTTSGLLDRLTTRPSGDRLFLPPDDLPAGELGTSPRMVFLVRERSPPIKKTRSDTVTEARGMGR